MKFSAIAHFLCLCRLGGAAKTFPAVRRALLIMKLTSLLILVVCIHVSAKGLAQEKITVSGKNLPLENVFIEIKKQTGYSFFYSEEQMLRAKKVTIDVKDAQIKEVMNECFKDQPFTYNIEGKTIFVVNKIERVRDSTSIDVRGKVVNENGDPVLASVMIKGSSRGATTNSNGEFILNDVNNNDVLIISGVNIITQEIKLNGKSEFTIVVPLKISTEQEVIINKGYYSTTKRFNTGNVVKIKGEELQGQTFNDPLKLLQGLVPGLNIRQQSGLPGGGFNTFEIRGQNSLLSNFNGAGLPLIIVDGVPLPSIQSFAYETGFYNAGMDLSLTNGLNPEIIESIEVLKDADATAIYGTRGANGVILISTKKARTGDISVVATVSHGAGKVGKYPKLLNTQQYLTMRREAFKNDGETPNAGNAPDLLLWDTIRYTNWEKELIGNTSQLDNINLSVSGGAKNSNFLFTAQHRKQTTVLPGNFYDKVTSANFDYNFSSNDSKLNISFQSGYSSGRNLMPINDPTNNIAFLAPNAPSFFKDDGSLNWDFNNWVFPYADLRKTSDAKQNSLLSSLTASYKVWQGLTIKSLFGYNQFTNETYQISPLTSFNPAYATKDFRMTQYGDSKATGWIIEPQLTYEYQTLKHNLNAVIGTTFQDNQLNTVALTGTGFSSDALMKNLALASSRSVNKMAFSQYRLNKFFGRIGYNYDGMYLINLTASREGSSRFGSNNLFGNFYSVGGGIIFSEYKFFKDNLKFLSFGKIRASYGTTGNDKIGDYQYLSLYQGIGLSYQNLPVLDPAGLTNPFYKWEIIKKLEVGLDLGVIGNRVNLGVSYYRNRTDNQLVGYALPYTTGFQNITANFPAIVQNTGIEITAQSTIVSNSKFKWEANFNISIPKNKLIAFPNLESSSYNTTYSVGKSLSAKYTYKSQGVDPATGLYKVADLNGDHSISSTDDMGFFADQKTYYYGGLNNSFRFKNLQIGFLVQFAKRDQLNSLYSFGIPGYINSNQPIEVFEKRWMKAGDNSKFQKPTQNFDGAMAFYNMFYSNAIYSNVVFARLRNIYANYTFRTPVKGLKMVKIFAEGQNLFSVSNWKGIDPESTTLSFTPPLRVVQAGIQISL